MKTTEILNVTTTEGRSTLCRACVAVLMVEGSLAGDPREEPWRLHTLKSVTPAEEGAQCIACVARDTGKAWRATALLSPSDRLFLTLLAAREHEGDDALASY